MRSPSHFFFNANVRAQKLGVTADVMARDSQASAGYWEIVRDALADLVRIMLIRCYDEANHKQLYDHVRGVRGQVWLCAFPNLFITIAPAEWSFPRPYFLEPYKDYISGCAYIMALHMYYLVRSIWGMLANKFGHRFFIVMEYTMKTEYQGRGTPHWHIAAWVVCFGLLANLAGRTKKIISPFVKFLELVFRCEIDVQVGNSFFVRLIYIFERHRMCHTTVPVSDDRLYRHGYSQQLPDCVLRLYAACCIDWPLVDA